MSIRNDVVRLSGGDNRLDVFDAFVLYANKCNIDYEYQMQQALSLATQLTYEDQLNSIMTVCDSILDAIIQQIGIHVYDNATTKDLINLANGVNTILDYEDKQSLLSVLDGDESNTDKLANLLEVSGVHKVEYWLGIFNYVAQYTIDAFKGHLKIVEETTPETLKIIDDKVNMYRHFKSVINDDVMSDSLLANANNINRDMDEYIPLLSSKISFYENYPELFVIDYYGFSILSKQGVDKFSQEVLDTAKAFYLSSNAQKTITLEITNLIQKLSSSDKRMYINTSPITTTE